MDPAGVVLRCNRAVCDLVGRPFAQVVGRPYACLIQEAFGLAAPPDLGFGTGEPGWPANEIRLGERWFAVTANPIRDGGGVSILAEVTRRKALEEQLRQGQKLEAIGRLAGGVAHDFNNLLTAVVGNAALLMQNLSRDAAEYELAAAIEQAAWRAAELTRQLLGFSRQTLLVAPPRQPQRLRRRGRRPPQAHHRPARRPRNRLRRRPGAGAGRPRTDEPGTHESVHQRVRRHAGGRPAAR